MMRRNHRAPDIAFIIIFFHYKNIDTVIELYKSIIDLAYEIKDFKIVSDYTFKLDELLKIIRKNR